MYSEKLEKLIEHALADGVLTEKEKQILLKNAEAEGIDLDEFEMVLDALLYKQQVPASKSSNTVNSLSTLDMKDSLSSFDIKGGSLFAAAFSLCQIVGKEADSNMPSELAGMVKKCAVGAAVAGAGSGWIPGAGATIATSITSGVVLTMFYQINRKLGLSLGENIVKNCGAGISAVLVGYLGGWGVGTAVSFIPGIGTAAAIAIDTVMCYSLTMASGILYFKVLTSVLQDSKDISTMGKENLQKIIKTTVKNVDMKALMKEIKATYKQSKQSGEIKK
jgi:uncharacterized protein (DUF697 family)